MFTDNDNVEKKKDVLRGLTDGEVLDSRRLHGSNRFTEKRRQSFFRRFLKELGDPIIRILLCALAVTLLIPGGEGGNLDAIGIAVAVLVATLVSTACEYGSERAFEAMQREAGEQRCRVIRDGIERMIAIGDVVVGDIVRLRAGEKAPADGRLIEGTLSCDLSALNGESVEQKRYAEEAVDGADGNGRSAEDRLGERSSIFRGSEITSGEGIMTVTAVGDGTYYGRMAVELQAESGESPLKLKLTKLAGTLSKFGYFCAISVGVSNLLFSTVFSSEFVFSFSALLSAFLRAATLSVSVVVMAVPEGLPMMITVVLASNMLKMQKERVLVRKPVGIETAGSINILFTDKTGTLTYGKPRVSCFSSAESESASAASLPEGIKRIMGWVSAYACGSETPLLREVGARNGGGEALSVKSGRSWGIRRKNDRTYNKYEGISVGGAGDAADSAIRVAFSGESGVGDGAERIAYLPFSSTEKICASTVALSGAAATRYGRELTLIKGAPEILLEGCEYAYSDDGLTVRMDREAISARLRALASKGMRVIAVVTSECGADAVRAASRATSVGERIDRSGLLCRATFVSFVCLKDNLRAEAADAIAELHGAGIQTVMITGDNPFTAEAIAREAGILPRGAAEYGEVLTGTELAALSDAELSALMPRLRVIARALPQDKSRLVRVASSLGLVVGMTGDGLNDAPALKQADVGFAMGSGTEIAKEAGDIVITDNNVASIVKAVHFGRTIFRSIRKFIVFQLTMNLCAVGISVIGPFIGYESPVTVMQMLWINIIIDTLAAVAFAGEAPLKSYMRELPTPKSEPVLSSDMLSGIFVMGVYTLMLCLYFLLSPRTATVFRYGGEERLLTGFFALFIFSGIIGALNARSTGINPFRGLWSNPVFLAVTCGVFTAQVAMIYYGGRVFGTVPISLGELRYVMSLALSVIPVGIVYRAIGKLGGGLARTGAARRTS